MRLSHRHEFVFLATPRTASTSVRDALDDYSDIKSVYKTQITSEFPFYHHISASELKMIFEQNGWDWSKYQTACFVRNPFDRVVSLFHHHIEKSQRTAPGKSVVYNSLRKIKYKYLISKKFGDFVKSLDSNSRLQSPVIDFVTDSNGKILVDDILRFEELSDSFVNWTSKINISEAGDSLMKLNSSKARNDYRSYYTDELVEVVRRFYKKDIEAFGYKFE